MSWLKIADEGQTAQVSEGSRLRFGVTAEDRFIQRDDLSGAVLASVAVFGDPARGVRKSLFLEMADITPDPTPAPTDPAMYAYTGPLPPVPTSASTDAQWDRYLRVQALIRDTAASVAAKLDRESRDRNTERQQAVADATRAMVDVLSRPQVVGRTPQTVTELAAYIAASMRASGSDLDAATLAQRALSDAQAIKGLES